MPVPLVGLFRSAAERLTEMLTCCSSCQVELPVWDRLDRASGWAELAAHSASDNIVQQIANFRPDAVLGVDWSSLPAFKALAAALQAKALPVPPYIYMNYRCRAEKHLPLLQEKDMSLAAQQHAATCVLC